MSKASFAIVIGFVWTGCERVPAYYTRFATRFHGSVDFVAAAVARDWTEGTESAAYVVLGSTDVKMPAREIVTRGECLIDWGLFGVVHVSSERTESGVQMVLHLGSPKPGLQAKSLPKFMLGIPIEYRFDRETELLFGRRK